MSTDQEAYDALRALAREPVKLSDEGIHVVRAAISSTPQQQSRLSFLDPGQFMFSATKLVVASAIVALFGGFLLAGVVTQPSDELAPAAVSASPSTTADLLPGVDLVTEEVEPGVYQVLSDGVRNLSRPADDEDEWLGGVLRGNIVAGLDGSVWWFGPDGFFRLGDRGEHGWTDEESSGVFISDDFAVAPDGTLWRSRVGYSNWNAASFDGLGWTEHSEDEQADGIEVRVDGTVWVLRNQANSRSSVARLSDDGWEVLPGSVLRADSGGTGGWPLSVVDEGEDAWLIGRRGLYQHDGEGWQRQPSPFGGLEVRRADVGPDGTLWARFGDFSDPSLARFDGVEWQTYTDGVPTMGDHYQGFEGWFEVAPDGSVWFNPFGDYEVTGTECDGIANFDGEMLTRFLRDTCIYAMDVAPDGDVWLHAGPAPEGQGPIQTYVITPEAVAVAERTATEPAPSVEPRDGDDTTTPDLLPGVHLVTEEVEPGVYRVLSDGTDNELDLGARDSDYGLEMVAGQDGSVWIVDESRVFRIGTEGSVDPRRLDPWRPDVSVAPDGTLWARGPDPDGGSRTVSALSGGTWDGPDLPSDGARVADIEAAGDGTVWATLLTEWEADACAMNPANVYGGGRLAVGRFTPGGGWLEELVEPATTVEWAELVVGPDGPEFLVAGPCSPDGLRLLERDEDGWAHVSIPEADRVADWSGISPVEIGPDGTVWAWANFEDDPWWKGSRLLRRTGGEWEVFGDAEPVPTVVGSQEWDSSMTVSADGRLWLALGGVTALDSHRETGHSVAATLEGPCPGVLSFDGASWTHHLAGACVTHISAAPNGNVWVMVEELDASWFDMSTMADRERAIRVDEAGTSIVPAGLYVITPEAVAVE